MLAGVLTSTFGLPRDSTPGTVAVTPAPSQTTQPLLVADAPRCALVICGQCRPADVSRRLVLQASGKPASSAPVVRLAFWLKPSRCANSCSSTATRSFSEPWLPSMPR